MSEQLKPVPEHNLDIVLQHFQRLKEVMCTTGPGAYRGLVNANEVTQTLHSLRFFNDAGLRIVGIGGVMYNGEDLKDVHISRWYGPGFIVIEKQPE